MESTTGRYVDLLFPIKDAMVMSTADMNIPILRQKSEDATTIDEPIEKAQWMRLGSVVRCQNDRSRRILSDQPCQLKLMLPNVAEGAEDEGPPFCSTVDWHDDSLS